MNEKMLRHMLNMKISLVRKGVEQLPESLQKPVKELEKQIMHVLYDISKEHLEKTSGSENTQQSGGLKAINVE